MALYLNWFSLTSVLPDLNYSLKHTSNLRRPDIVSSRLKALEFWEKHGLAAAMDYAGVSRATFYNWRKALSDSRKLDKRCGRARLKALDPKSTKPLKCKSANWPPMVVSFIEQTSLSHPELGKQKLYHLLRRYLEDLGQTELLVSESTVGRILKQLREHGRLSSKDKLSYNARTNRLSIRKKHSIKKLRRKDLGFKVKQPGDLVQIDGVEGHWLGKHYYIINAIDYASSKAVSCLLVNKSSAKTAEFLRDLSALMGFPIKAIQTDNGSEYTARFHEMADKLGIKHCFNYVKKPIYNGKIERFNRTIQEALSYSTDFLYDVVDDPERAQATIDSYLGFYNNDRPHASLNFRTPNEFLLQYQLA